MPDEPSPADGELWERIRAGDRNAFAIVFDRHSSAVYSHLLRRTADWTEAEDLTSAVFLTAWRRRNDIRLDRDSALPWLLGIGNRTLANGRRSLRRHRALMGRLPLPPHTPDHADDIARRIDNQRAARILHEELTALPKREREAVELCWLGGLDQQAAATALGIPVGTVKSRLNRARRRLASSFATMLIEEPT
ncbi:RNA polymerase sigma factor [Uniformispora flossi]|uniref:RNA polymerase sigma factor n=1 Tax=Uniformispora flossi TaxID=3390723 RepID=UPI003C2D9B49